MHLLWGTVIGVRFEGKSRFINLIDKSGMLSMCNNSLVEKVRASTDVYHVCYVAVSKVLTPKSHFFCSIFWDLCTAAMVNRINYVPPIYLIIWNMLIHSGMYHSCEIVGAKVYAKAIHVTTLSYCARRYGLRSKRKKVQVMVSEALKE